jgi:ribosomal protein S16
MGKYRITYMDSWKDKKTIVIEALGYWDANDQAKKMFGESNIISVDDLEPKPVEENTSKFTEFADWYSYGDIQNYDD